MTNALPRQHRFSRSVSGMQNGQPLHSLLDIPGDVLAAGLCPQTASRSRQPASTRQSRFGTPPRARHPYPATAWRARQRCQLVARWRTHRTSTIGHPSLIWDAQFPDANPDLQHNTPGFIFCLYDGRGRICGRGRYLESSLEIRAAAVTIADTTAKVFSGRIFTRWETALRVRWFRR